MAQKLYDAIIEGVYQQGSNIVNTLTDPKNEAKET
jgi:hypothetical protein